MRMVSARMPADDDRGVTAFALTDGGTWSQPCAATGSSNSGGLVRLTVEFW
jgi:hypothetical protein